MIQVKTCGDSTLLAKCCIVSEQIHELGSCELYLREYASCFVCNVQKERSEFVCNVLMERSSGRSGSVHLGAQPNELEK